MLSPCRFIQSVFPRAAHRAIVPGGSVVCSTAAVRYYVNGDDVMKVLNVAEKNDAARSIAQLLSGGNLSRREGCSKFNKIYEFDYNLMGQQCRMIMTSVSGHLLNYEFPSAYRKWTSCLPVQLFDCPISKSCMPDFEPIKKTLEREVRSASKLIIWTDCDREGENIGFEIIEVCRCIKPNIPVFRARFSEITSTSVRTAVQRLQQPDARANAAVDVRQQLDLRIGAAFTRFQTLRLKRVFPASLADQLISYGSCQFPTLGFVVERFKAIEDFVQEPFWKLKVTHVTDQEEVVEFGWNRNRLFDELSCHVLYEMCCDNPLATVISVKSKPKSKWRPTPLDTVEFEKLCSRKLRINAKTAMRIAEKLYTQGFISYPRTETNIFPKEMALPPLVQAQTSDSRWGDFASRLLESGVTPRQGKKSDQAHPPIHPIKYTSELSGDDARVYELVVRHFLACLSKDAQGHETSVNITVADEQFSVSGLAILARNYLEVYPYDKWSERQIPVYRIGDTFNANVAMDTGMTSPPTLLTEADLITLMEKHGIGTDATHADHIETIKSRQYVGLQESRFVPGRLGLGLVQGYDSMGFHMSKPHLRSELEADLKRICEGSRQPDAVLTEQIQKYRQVFEEAMQKASCLDTALASYIGETPSASTAESGIGGDIDQLLPICSCPSCHQPVVVKTARESGRPFLSCCGFPSCRVVMWLPQSVSSVEPLADRCRVCVDSPRLIRFTFTGTGLAPFYDRLHTACVGGCDSQFMETVGLRPLREVTSAYVPASSSSTASRPSHSQSVLSTFDSGVQLHSSTSNQSTQRINIRPLPLTQISTNTDDLFSRPRPSRSFLTNQNAVPVAESGSPADASDIVCTCGRPARKLTVRKDGPNKGRQFYRCGGDDPGSGCSFFLWATDDAGAGERQSRDQPATLSDSASVTRCRCGVPARRATVQKEGPNQGRAFMVCSKPREQQCGFFEWGDSNIPSYSADSDGGFVGRGGFGGQRRGRGARRGGHSARGSSRSARGTGRGRRCGLCHEPGHTRKNCPESI